MNRLVFCMSAEDVGLLPDAMFSRMLEHARRRPEEFATLARDLFGAMSVGGRVGFETVEWFNGGLFEDDAALPMDKAQVETTLDASALDWSSIDPSILGTLFERGLDPDKRSQLGAHYTDRDKIMRIIDPVIVRPWLAEWKTAKARIASSLEHTSVAKSKAAVTRHRRQAKNCSARFSNGWGTSPCLPPCGSGNFLYLALHALQDLEHRVQLEAEALGLQRAFPSVGPANVKGIELNAYAAELARVSVWIGEIQWTRRNGFPGSREPVLDPLETIECRDAILRSDGGEPEWPEADVIIGNPPFLGGKLLIANLGEEYVSTLFRVCEGRVPREADLVCYWFVKAGDHLGARAAKRVGLVATNSIRGGANRRALERATGGWRIFDAWSDEPRVIDGAAVRVSLVCFSHADDELTPERRLDGETVDEIYMDFTARRGGAGVDLTKARRLARNAGVAFMGDTKGGPFDVPGDLAREWLQEPANPNGRPNSDVLAPWMNGMAITRRPADKWIVDFGWTMVKEEAALYEGPFQHAREHVYPMRRGNRRESYGVNWWWHVEPRQGMWKALDTLSRYIVTPTVAKHGLFAWLEARVCPDHQLIVIAREDDTTFGILHSRCHEAWSLRLGTWLGKGNDSLYTPATSFETFPFPEGISPDVPASDYLAGPRAQAIASAARRLVELRDRWLNPPEWVEWVEEPVPRYPPRPVPHDKRAATALKKWTLTNLYDAHSGYATPTPSSMWQWPPPTAGPQTSPTTQPHANCSPETVADLPKEAWSSSGNQVRATAVSRRYAHARSQRPVASSQGAGACPPRSEAMEADHTRVRLQGGHSSRRVAFGRSGHVHTRAVGLVPPRRVRQPGEPTRGQQVQETIRSPSDRGSRGSGIHGSGLPDLWLANQRPQERFDHRGTPGVLRDVSASTSRVFVTPPPAGVPNAMLVGLRPQTRRVGYAGVRRGGEVKAGRRSTGCRAVQCSEGVGDRMYPVNFLHHALSEHRFHDLAVGTGPATVLSGRQHFPNRT